MRSLSSLCTACVLIAMACVPANCEAEELRVYIGSYTRGTDSDYGIHHYRFSLETGALTEEGEPTTVKNASFLAIHPSKKFLYSVSELGPGQGGVSGFQIHPGNGNLTKINSQPAGGAGPCHVMVDQTGTTLMVANYGGGSTGSYQLDEKGAISPQVSFFQHHGSSINQRRQKAPHAHSINLSRDNRFAYVADLGIDKVMIYQLEAETGKLLANNPDSVAMAPGSGPRHFAFHPSGKYAFVINELLSTITVCRYNPGNGGLTVLQTISTLPKGFSENNTTAEVVVHPSGKFVYGSNRGHDSIAVFSFEESTGMLSFVEHEPSGGKTPRNFNVDPTGKFMITANQSTDNLHVYHVDQKTGALSDAGVDVKVQKPVCVKFMTLAE